MQVSKEVRRSLRHAAEQDLVIDQCTLIRPITLLAIFDDLDAAEHRIRYLEARQYVMERFSLSRIASDWED